MEPENNNQPKNEIRMTSQKTEGFCFVTSLTSVNGPTEWQKN